MSGRLALTARKERRPKNREDLSFYLGVGLGIMGGLGGNLMASGADHLFQFTENGHYIVGILELVLGLALALWIIYQASKFTRLRATRN